MPLLMVRGLQLATVALVVTSIWPGPWTTVAALVEAVMVREFLWHLRLVERMHADDMAFERSLGR